MQAYSDPSRADDEHALPDVEVFFRGANECVWTDEQGEQHDDGAGWFYWYCFPGCLPDSDPVGPFISSAAALADARQSC